MWGREVLLMHPGQTMTCLYQIVNKDTFYYLFFLNWTPTALPMSSFSLTFCIFCLQGVRSWPRELTCVSSMWSTQRAERASCSASRRTRRGSWRPRPRTPGWSSSARYRAHSKLELFTVDLMCFYTTHLYNYVVFIQCPWLSESGLVKHQFRINIILELIFGCRSDEH